jgi:SAM-dependent methyltransferase
MSAGATIHSEIHRDLPREGPGDAASTRRAWLATGLTGSARILDVGCGPGAQTLDLAAVSAGYITALDIDRSYLLELSNRLRSAQVAHRVDIVQASMFAMPFRRHSFDIVWSEGAMYFLGFARALREWRRLIRRRGYIAATHLSWLEDAMPDEPRRFWARAFPDMQSIDDKVAAAAAAGFDLVEQFALPESAWWSGYYRPMEQRLAALRKKYRDDNEAMTAIENSQAEIELYRRFSRYYGYVFYVLRVR